jgi:ABC-type transport system involved in multi-copper enzyme maturation permease subunit
MPRQFFGMVAAEIRKVFTRGAAIGALTIAIAVGFGAVLVMWRVKTWGEGGPTVNGAALSDLMTVSGLATAGGALQARNFFILPLFLLLASASAVGGEISDRTMRELLVRPVPRWSVLLAKLIALSLVSAASLVLTLVPALGLGTAIFGLSPEGYQGPGTTDLLGGYAASFLSDVGLITLGMAASMVLRSVGGTVVAVVLILGADLALRGVVKALSMFGMEEAAAIQPWLLGNALGCWEGWKETWALEPFGALAAFTAVFCAFGVARFQRLDVP